MLLFIVWFTMLYFQISSFVVCFINLWIFLSGTKQNILNGNFLEKIYQIFNFKTKNNIKPQSTLLHWQCLIDIVVFVPQSHSPQYIYL